MYTSKTPTYKVLNAALTLPDAASTVESESFEFLKRGYRTIVRVYANTEITVLAEDVMTATLEISADDNSFVALYSSALNLTAPSGNTVYAIGDLICEQVVPENFVANGKYVRISITADTDQTAGKVDVVVDAL